MERAVQAYLQNPSREASAIASDKSTVFVIPDRSLWYLPLSAMLDAEDLPFGRDRLVSVIPSVDTAEIPPITGSEKAANHCRRRPSPFRVASVDP